MEANNLLISEKVAYLTLEILFKAVEMNLSAKNVERLNCSLFETSKSEKSERFSLSFGDSK